MWRAHKRLQILHENNIVDGPALTINISHTYCAYTYDVKARVLPLRYVSEKKGDVWKKRKY